MLPWGGPSPVPDGVPLLDLREASCYNACRLRGSYSAPWLWAKRGRLFSVLPPRGAVLSVCGDDRSVLDDCVQTLTESGYTFQGVYFIPDWGSIPADQLAFGAPKRPHVVWEPNPVLSERWGQLEAMLPLAEGNVFVDFACGSGRDVVWALASSPSRFSLGLGLEKNMAQLENLAILGRQCGLPVSIAKAGEGDLSCWAPSEASSRLVGAQVDCRDEAAVVRAVPGRGASLLNVSRYKDARLWANLRKLVCLGGLVVYHHFMVGSFRPSSPSRLIHPGELAAHFGPEQGFEVMFDEVHVIGDGRPTSSFCARRAAPAAGAKR